MPDLKSFFERLAGVEKILNQHLQAQAPPELSKRLSARLDELKSASDNPLEIPIALIGPARVGKSTLINSFLGARILTEDDLRFCTAAITILRFHDKSNYGTRWQNVADPKILPKIGKSPCTKCKLPSKPSLA